MQSKQCTTHLICTIDTKAVALQLATRHKGTGKRGHIVADTLLLMMFLGLRKLRNICCGHKMFLNKIRNIFCVLKVVANEDTLLRTHCCRNKCFPVCRRAQHLLRTQILCPGHKNVMSFFAQSYTKMFLILFRNILCPQHMFPSLRAQGNVMSNNVSATTCPRLPPP